MRFYYSRAAGGGENGGDHPESLLRCPMDPFPRGENDPAYRWAFVAWMILFFSVISLGLANFLYGVVRARFGG